MTATEYFDAVIDQLKKLEYFELVSMMPYNEEIERIVSEFVAKMVRIYWDASRSEEACAQEIVNCFITIEARVRERYPHLMRVH